MEDFIKNIEDLKNRILINKNFKFQIKVIAGSKIENMEFFEDFIKIKIKEKPIEGRANKAVIGYISKTLKIPKSKIAIVSGLSASNKIVEIML